MTTKFYPIRLDFSPAVFPAVGVGTPARRAEAGFSGAALPPLGSNCEISGRERRRERYALQSQSRNWLKNTTNPKGKPWRVVNCNHAMAGGSGVAVLHSQEHGRARYGNLQTCGSGHVCPVCGARLGEYKGEEIRAGMNLHTEAGGHALMVTLTHSHGQDDSLKSMIKAESKALEWMTGHRAYKRLHDELGLVGTIRAREITYGELHAWHPHIHDLWLITVEITPELIADVEDRVWQLWQKACAKFDLPAPRREYGVDVTIAMSPADYLSKFGRDTKWGTARELTKANSKRGKEGRYTPFDLLRGDVPISRAKAEALWREYADATYGATQISWSRGLKDDMGICQVSDDAIASGTVDENKHVRLGMLTPEQWRAVCKAKMRAQVLDEAETGGWSAVQRLVNGLCKVDEQEVSNGSEVVCGDPCRRSSIRGGSRGVPTGTADGGPDRVPAGNGDGDDWSNCDDPRGDGPQAVPPVERFARFQTVAGGRPERDVKAKTSEASGAVCGGGRRAGPFHDRAPEPSLARAHASQGCGDG